MHEFLLGALSSLNQYAQMMKSDTAMSHNQPYMTHVAPRETSKSIWRFSKTEKFYLPASFPGTTRPACEAPLLLNSDVELY